MGRKGFSARFTILGLLPGLAFGCSCAGERLPCRAALSTEVIFTGRVVAADARPTETRYTFQVTRSLKTTAAATIDVTAGNDGASCGVRFEAGQEYLVFAYHSGGTLVTNLCSGSTPIAFAGATLRFFATFPSGVPAADAVLLHGIVTQRESDLIRGGEASWPAAGVHVIAWQGTQRIAETTTAPDGTYSFSRLPAGPYRISVEGPGDFRTPRTGALATAAPGKCEEISFYNAARAQLGGVLRDADGELDESTDVVLLPAGAAPKPVPGQDSELETDTDSGAFLLEVPPGRYRLGFRELGYTDLVYYPRELLLEAGGNPRIHFQLPRRRHQTVEGVVVDSTGRTVEGASVSLAGQAPDGAVISGSVVTPASGQFEFEVMPLDYEIRVRIAACGDSPVAKAVVRKDQRDPVRLTTPAQCP